MGAWGKFHPAEYSIPCRTQHAEWPAYQDNLPYQWQAAPLWDRAQRLVTLSNDVPPNPNKAQHVGCRYPVILSYARWKLETPNLSLDVHPNPGHPKTTTLHALTLNVGGSHLSRRRWGPLLQEITASSPHIIALQEVRFKTGEAHLAYTAKACPNYQPLAHDDKRPDMMFLVHERVHKYCKLMAHRSPHPIALRIHIPGVPEFTFVNQHGPFTLREREALDALNAYVPNVGILGGDFNDGIWHASPRCRRIWHTGSTPAALLTRTPNGTSTARPEPHPRGQTPGRAPPVANNRQ